MAIVAAVSVYCSELRPVKGLLPEQGSQCLLRGLSVCATFSSKVMVVDSGSRSRHTRQSLNCLLQ